MGPRQRCRGRHGNTNRGRHHPRGFNGATTKVSWKAQAEGLSTQESGSGFNGATTKVSWKALFNSTLSYATIFRFNGATTKVSWKALGELPEVRGQSEASMGPRQRCRGRHRTLASTPASYHPLQWGHDKGVVEGLANQEQPAIKEIASMGPRQRCRGRPDLNAQVADLKAASMGPRQRCRGRPSNKRVSSNGASKASMGPRQRCRGRPGRASRVCRVASPLQWGHDEGVVEGEFSGPTAADVEELQWGHDKGVVEGGAGTAAERAARTASMGPRQRCRGRLECLAEAVSIDGSFNGATTKVSWKARCRLHSWTAGYPLQWGHDKGVVEGWGIG